MLAVALGAETAARLFLVLEDFFDVFFRDDVLDEALEVDLETVDLFLVVFFFAFFLAAEAWEDSKTSALNISGRPIQSHTPNEIAPAAISVIYLLEFIICKITKNSTYSQPLNI
ncbi:MAG: hypothetical protein HDR47_03160 [Bacteroides sp.]|nr:hypothetical protein [Bacteroides sp.]MDE6856886.1 hypothetical protein [Muribaculaceae bacterium]